MCSLTDNQQATITFLYSGTVFTLGNSHIRRDWVNSFYVNPTPNNVHLLNFTGWMPPGLIGYGSPSKGAFVAGNDQVTYSLIGPGNPSLQPLILHLYVKQAAPAIANLAFVTSTSAAFPAGSIAIAYFICDSVGRVQQTIDARTSFLSSIPATGSLTEVVSVTVPLVGGGTYTYDATKRFSLQ